MARLVLLLGLYQSFCEVIDICVVGNLCIYKNMDSDVFVYLIILLPILTLLHKSVSWVCRKERESKMIVAKLKALWNTCRIIFIN